MKNQPDERSVYLALNNVFCGTDAQLRKNKKIRELILKHQKDINVQDLIHAHNLDNVCNVAKILLEQQVFESTLKAKIRFPEVFEVSPAQSAERSASEQEAARSEADAIHIVAESSSRAAPHLDKNSHAEEKGVTSELSTGRSAASLGKRKHQSTTSSIPSLYPVYLPYWTQHKILVTVQEALESACYAFALQSLPQILEQREWKCAEEVELNLWARVLVEEREVFPVEDVSELGKSIQDLMGSIAQLRHTAVHRLRISVSRVECLLRDAESLAKLLRDVECMHKLSRLRRETTLAIEDIKRKKDLLESQLTVQLKKIAAQRADLDRLEQSVIADMMKEDHEYVQFAGTILSQAINSPDTVVHSAASTEQDDDDSDTDVSDHRSLNINSRSCKDD